MDSKKYIAVVDIGSTSTRCFIFTRQFEIIGKSFVKNQYVTPKSDYLELLPDIFFMDFLRVLKEAINDAKVTPEEICLGISTQRTTFLAWNKTTGELIHNFISWKDKRGREIVDEINNRLIIKFFRTISTIVYLLTRITRFKAFKSHIFDTYEITSKLSWVFRNNQKFRDAVSQNNVCLGTIDTWLLYKLKDGKGYKFVTEISNVSSTGLFDPYSMQYGLWNTVFRFKSSMFPKPVDTLHNFGNVDAKYFGSPIQISAIIADQSASLFGNGCLEKGSAKITLGTGSFVNINTGSSCRGMDNGYISLVGWKFKINDFNEKKYFIQHSFYDSMAVLEWAQSQGLYEDVRDTSNMAIEAGSNDHVYFVPKFSTSDSSYFVGAKESTDKNHLVRAVLESIVFSVAEIFLLSEKYRNSSVVRIDGGISNNDFICQMLADLCEIYIERSTSVEMTSYGVAYLCAIKSGFLKSMDEVKKLYKHGRMFAPRRGNTNQLLDDFNYWISLKKSSFPL